jgi:hypothetical protein
MENDNRSQAMMTVQHLTFNELSERLRGYERRYGYSTIEFYRRFQDGELGDDDDLMMWAGLYHLYLTSLPVRQFMQSELAAA